MRPRPTLATRQSLAISILVLMCSLLIIGGGILTAAAYTLTQQRVDRQTNLKFEEITDTHVHDLLHHMEKYGDMLYAARGLFAATAVDADTWNRFVHAQSAPGRYAGMKAIAYAQIVPAKHIGAHEQTLRSQHEGLQIHPKKETGDYIVLTHHEEVALSDAKQSKALGFDLASSPERMSALNKANTSGVMSATARINLATTGQPGFLLVLPLTDRIGSPGTSVFGYSIAAFDVEEFVAATLGSRLERYQSSVRIADITTDQPVQMYAKNFETSGRIIQRDMQVQVADRTWRVTFETPAANLLVITDRLAPLVVLVAGISFVVLFCIIAYTLKLRYKLSCTIDPRS